MDVSLLLQHSQYAIPVGIVLVCAILVFVFGFKNAEQPPFAQLSSSSDVDRKLAGKKRSKIREKRSANGQIATEKASPVKKVSPVKAEPVKKSAAKSDDVDGKLKEQKQDDNKPNAGKKEKNQAAPKSGKENKVEQAKNKKNLAQEKPVDFDDGGWEQAYSRKDKKNKKKDEETPSKKSKKAKKTDLINEVTKDKEQEKPEIKDKVAKETENKELKEKDKKEVILTPITADPTPEEKVSERKEEVAVPKIEKVEKVEEKKSKAKKGKKVSESEGTPPISESPTPRKDEKHVEKVAEKKMIDESKKKPEIMVEPPIEERVEEKAALAFDELGDVWTEAKPQKKSKKKARKDN
ncbi:uncharacterized protein AH6.3 isoform X2 [Cephus cinctus]|uniref:Uncharacterized protein AH6.3 isoform X2 n=1 Tax=Cephus cinctus TaxID=211228 RepID=A0AAJ7FGM0_CEPCN|nr:uncharacterized protein AH6.3 isoform X2 [Cephus cinctus]